MVKRFLRMDPGGVRAAARGWRGGLVLVALCLTVYLPGLFWLPAVDRDESRFAQASRQMFESVALAAPARDDRPIARDEAGGLSGGMHAGGLVVPMVQQTPRVSKPPLIYWVQAGSAALLTWGEPGRDAIWMYRVPSVLAAVVAVLLTWRLGASMFDPRAGWLAGALLAVCPVVVWEAHQARADMVLLACTTGAMWALWHALRVRKQARPEDAMGESGPDAEAPRRGPPLRHVPGGWGMPVVLWLAVGAGVMTKGPITAMVVVLTVLALCAAMRRWRWVRVVRPMMGIVIVCAMVVPWVWVAAQRVEPGTFWSIIADEVLGRSVSAREGHWGPPGYHTVLMVVLFWPGSMLTGWSFVRAWKRGLSGTRARESSRVSAGLFLLCWVVPSWIVFELVTTKLPHYTLPMYPALALISARGVLSDRPIAPRSVAGVGVVLWAVVGLAATAAVAIVSLIGIIPGAWVVVCAARALRRWNIAALQLWGIGCAVVLGVCAVGVVIPVAPVWNTPAIVRALERADPGGARPLADVDYREDSLVFAMRGRVQRLEPDRLRAWWAERPDGIAIVDSARAGNLPGTRQVAGSGGPVPQFNYSNGRMESLSLVELDR